MIGKIIFVLILLIGGYIFFNQIQAFANDWISVFNQNTREAESKIPAPKAGEVVCDLLVTIKGKWIGGGNPFVLQHVIYLNDGNNKVTSEWNNCYVKKASTYSLLSVADLYQQRIQGLEFIVPRGSYVTEKFFFSTTLVEPDSGKEKKLPQHQLIPVTIPPLKNEYIFTPVKVVYREIVRQDYQLYIYVDGDSDSPARFADHGTGEAYRQDILK